MYQQYTDVVLYDESGPVPERGTFDLIRLVLVCIYFYVAVTSPNCAKASASASVIFGVLVLKLAFF